MPHAAHFYGDSRAMIWHDGRGDKNKKTGYYQSSFDAKTPTLLGRYHHDSQFYLIKCKMSKNVLDGNIHYAYSDKVLDPVRGGYVPIIMVVPVKEGIVAG